MRTERTARGVEIKGGPTKKGWRSGRPGCMHYTEDDKESDRRFHDRYDAAFIDVCVARLGNGAWRWGSDPEHEYRDPPGPALGTTKKEWSEQHAGRKNTSQTSTI